MSARRAPLGGEGGEQGCSRPTRGRVRIRIRGKIGKHRRGRGGARGRVGGDEPRGDGGVRRESDSNGPVGGVRRRTESRLGVVPTPRSDGGVCPRQSHGTVTSPVKREARRFGSGSRRGRRDDNRFIPQSSAPARRFAIPPCVVFTNHLVVVRSCACLSLRLSARVPKPQKPGPSPTLFRRSRRLDPPIVSSSRPSLREPITHSRDHAVYHPPTHGYHHVTVTVPRRAPW